MFGASLLTVTTIASAVLVGSLLALVLGNLAAVVRKQFDLSPFGETGLKALFLASLMCFLVVGGLLTDQWGVHDVLVVGSLLAAFSLASLALSKNFPSVLVFVGLLGAASGLLYTATTVAMPTAFFPDAAANTHDRWYVPAATNLGFIFVTLGGLVVPQLILMLVHRLYYRNGLLILALLAVVPACGAALLTSAPDIEPVVGINLGQLFTDIRFWLALAAVFAFYGVESSTLLWAPKYLGEIGLTERSRSVLWIMFWTIFLCARLASANIHHVNGYIWLLLILTLVTASLVGNMIGMFRARPGATGFLMLGGCFGPAFPTLAGLILVLFRTQPAVALGLLCGAGTLARLLVTPLADRLLGKGGTRSTMTISLVLELVVFFPPLIWLSLPH